MVRQASITVVAVVLFCAMFSTDVFAGDDEKKDRYAVAKEDTFTYVFAGLPPELNTKLYAVKKGIQLKLIKEERYGGETWYWVESEFPHIIGNIQERFLQNIGQPPKGDSFFRINPKLEFGAIFVSISLPEQSDFAKGGITRDYGSVFQRVIQSCPQCEEPNNPGGPVAYIGGGITLRIASRAVLGGGILVNGVPTNFRTGFTDRNRWPAPGEGEAYTYTRISNLGHFIPYVNLGFMGTFDRKSRSTYFGSYEFGVRWLKLQGLTLEQGFDRFNMRDPLRTTNSAVTILQSYYFEAHYQEKMLGIFGTLFFIPPTAVDFGEFGQARLKGLGLSGGLSVKF